jgi:DNA-binding HxlR family transcriptional regulator
MKSYEQYCAVARALDVVGDRWTMLVIRELFSLGTARYADLMDGIPGVSTNLLADRLRTLQDAGVIERRSLDRPVPGVVYALTARGEALWPVLRELGTWGGPLLMSGQGDDSFRTHWLAVPARLHLTDRDPNADPITVVIDPEPHSEALTVTVGHGRIETNPGDDGTADARLSGDPQSIVRTLVGVRSPGEPGGATFTGNPGAFVRMRPNPFTPPA